MAKKGEVKHKDRVGEKFTTNEGYEVEITNIEGYVCTIRYADGSTKSGVYYYHLKAGNIRKPFNRIGEQWKTNEGYLATIIEYHSNKSVDVILPNGVTVLNKRYIDIIKGHISNPYHKSKFNVGYIGIGEYSSSSTFNSINIYERWCGILERCYGKRAKAYADVTVSEEWMCFQNFAEWFVKNLKPHIDETWELDKDIICKKCRVYSSETCAFVPKEINRFFVVRVGKKGNLPIGVFKDGAGFGAQIVTKGKKYLGYYKTPEEAFQAYKKAKEEYAKEIAIKWKDKINDIVYNSLMNYEIKITD